MLIDTSGDSVRFSAQKGSGNNEFRFLTQSSGTVTEKLRITSAGRLAILNNDENIDMDSSSNGQFQIDGNGYVGAITMNATGMFLYHNSNSRIIGIGVNETEVGRFTTGGYEQRFSNTSTYSTTTGSRKGIYVFNSGATTNCYASLELGANNSNGHFGSTILNSIATADTSYSNHFAIQLRHGGNYAERLRIQSDGHIVSGSNNTQNFGSSSNIWAGIFANYARFSANLAVGSSSLQNANAASFKGGDYNQVNIAHSGNGSWGMLLTNSNSSSYNSGYHETTNSSVNSPIAIINVNSDCLYLGTNNTARWRVEHDGHFIPLSSLDIGSSGKRVRTIYAANALNTSDRNEKNTITESDLGLDFICKLKPVSYKWNQKEGGGLDTKTHYGLISQDVEEVIIETGKTLDDFGAVDKPDGDPMGLSYNEFISPLVKAIQEQQEQIKILQEKIAALEGS